MEQYPIRTINPLAAFPALGEIPEPPESLSVRGSFTRMKETTPVAVVGSRNCSQYGIDACRKIISGLAGHSITIISGLARGIDTVAHTAALDAGLATLAFPGSGLNWNVLYPYSNRDLAYRILSSGGALISEYEDTRCAAPWTFPKRNRLEAAISAMTIVIEAEEKSGTLITARLALEYNRIVGAVPGPIDSDTSKGAHWLLQLGAVPITSAEDILRELQFSTPPLLPETILNEHELCIFDLLISPKTHEELMEDSGYSSWQVQMACVTLEIKGVITQRLGRFMRIA